MSVAQILVLIGLGASALLFSGAQNRLYPVLGLIASGLEALIAFGFVNLSVRGLSVWLVLSVAMLTVGALAWLKASGKVGVTAAALLAMVGAVQLLNGLF